MIKKFIQLILLLILSVTILEAQVTTGSISGVVKTGKGEVLQGASVTAILESSGTVLTTSTTTGGRFNFPNLPPGGPYTIKVSHVGYAESVKQDVYVALGDRFEASFVLESASEELSNVIVTATQRKGEEKTGASTNVSKFQVASTPNINRSIMSLTKLAPQSNGNYLMGVSSRFNNITIDGSIFNNNFGLSGGGLPGGEAQPISIDAVDVVQINLAPYDVRQTGFTGGGINAVTKRGTNNFTGSIYDYFRPESFNGSKVKDRKITTDGTSKNIFGVTVGGPIIKNKLFFFVNYETEKRTMPGQQNIAYTAESASDPNVSLATKADMDRVSDFVKKTYGYDPGPYEGYNFHLNATKILARIDWNINSSNRFSIRYNQGLSGNDVLINAASGPNPRLGGSRRGGNGNGLGFANSNYVQNNDVYSIVGELNSTINNSLSNQLLASYTLQKDYRESPGSFFPFVEIATSATSGSNYMSLGTELYTYKNSVENGTFNIADNITYNVGKHSITGGISFDYMKFLNSYGSFGGSSYYRYKSVDDFINGASPILFALTYSNTAGYEYRPAEASFAQIGWYAQDMFAITDKFKLTYGLRFDLPLYPMKADQNPALAERTFKDAGYADVKYDVSKWPKSSLLISPRIGFTWDPMGDKTLVVRGGTGIFTGRIPFVWMVNQAADNGVLNTIQTISDAATLDNRKFNKDRNAYVPATLPTPGTSIVPGSGFSVFDPNFKMPQVWRSSFAIDKQIYNTWGITFEAIYSKTVNSPIVYNANAGTVKGTLTGAGNDHRDYLTTGKLNSDINLMVVNANTSKGYNVSLTAQITKKLSDGFEGNLAYSYNVVKDANAANADQSSSAFGNNGIIYDPRNPQLGYSSYSIPHKITANMSYRIEYAKHKAATTIALYYAAYPQERYHFKYSSFDINNDGSNSNDILYIPKDASEITFKTATFGGTAYTAQQQSDAFFKFVENDKYLREHKGQYVTRYGGVLPWVHSLDIRLLQDFKVKVNNKSHALQLSVDVVNALNMISKNWGYRYRYGVGSYSDMAILGGSVDATTLKPTFTFDPRNTKSYDVNYGTSSTWGMQIGVRYTFN